MEKTKFKFTEILALFFRKNIDSNLAIYTMVKGLNKYVRYIFYIFLIFGSSFGFYYLSFFLLENNSLGLSENILKIFEILFIFSSIYIFMICSSVSFYESVVNTDFKLLVEKQKEQNRMIKEQKAEKWRLRNMNIFLRFVIYFMIWFSILQFYYYGVISFLANSDINENEMIRVLNEEMNSFTIYLTVASLIAMMIVEFFIKKNKNKGIKDEIQKRN